VSLRPIPSTPMHHHIPSACVLLTSLVLCGGAAAQGDFSRADSLRGSIGPERAWWNVKHYDITVRPDFTSRTIQATTTIRFESEAAGERMQIDLQQPLVVDSIFAEFSSFWGGPGDAGMQRLEPVREGNVIWLDLGRTVVPGTSMKLHIHYHGAPRAARNPPWDGGWVWKTDARGTPWMSVACQGLGASVWYPCKDHQSDEPDDGADLRIIAPEGLVGVGNGRLKESRTNEDGTSTWHWAVVNPINTYNIIPYIGRYVHFGSIYNGIAGPLSLDYWVLEQDLEKARAHFTQVPPMLDCFEEYLGPFPWYEDGFKLVQAPYLGMEHQSAVAYGNGFVNGYRGADLSRTGHGLLWDYIIVHESGHEWYGNSITTADIADMWVQEGFTVYTEVLFTQCQQGLAAANAYMTGMRRNIVNDKPVIGPHGVNEEGSGDMYYKGASVVHMVRAMLNDDVAFWTMIRDMNRTYRHAIVTSTQIERFMDERLPFDLQPFFEQYLRTTRIPVLEWRIKGGRLLYRWSGTVPGFTMPVDVTLGDSSVRLVPTSEWQTLEQRVRGGKGIQVDERFYINARRVSAP
jgi:aminopeptidase N